MLRIVSTMAVMVGLLAACGDSNPLIGKWKPATKGMACNMLGTIEFTEKMVITHIISGPVTYSRDGARYMATTGQGFAFIFEKAGKDLKMISPYNCEMVKA